MKAVVIVKEGVAALREIPDHGETRKGYLKIKTRAVALNPTDSDHVNLVDTVKVGRKGGILGCDVAGEVVDDVSERIDCPNSTQFKTGDRVYGVCHGANRNGPEDGAYAEYAWIRDGHLGRIPDGMSFEEVAGLGVGITSVGQALYSTLRLPLKGLLLDEAKTPYWDEAAKEISTVPSTILISGGSSATGTLAIQFAKLSGLKVIATASPQNFDLLKECGADECFDYNDPACGKKINEYTKNALTTALDCVSTTDSFKLIAEALAKSDPDGKAQSVLMAENPRLVALLPTTVFKALRPDVVVHETFAYHTMGEELDKFIGSWGPARVDIWEFGVKFWKLSARLLAEGKIKPHPVKVQSKGLSGVPEGIMRMSGKTGEKPSGYKLVYRVKDTGNVEEFDAVSHDETLVQRELVDWAGK